ncbi:MAG: hypothetical protein ACI81R_001633 [Bradymonadia bacterium]|jgi:hypothetical protein
MLRHEPNKFRARRVSVPCGSLRGSVGTYLGAVFAECPRLCWEVPWGSLRGVSAALLRSTLGQSPAECPGAVSRVGKYLGAVSRGGGSLPRSVRGSEADQLATIEAPC